MIQALIFDFDGLILDTEVSAFQSWQEIYQEHNSYLPLEKWAQRIGGTAELFDAFAYLEEQIGRAVERAILQERRLQRHLALLEAQTTLPGVESLIADAKQLGLKIGLASSSPRSWVVGHLSRLGLISSFDTMRCGDEVTHKKPNPEIYLAVLDALGVKAEQAIALEDSPNGVRAAQRAGIFCVAIPNPITGQLSLEHADLKLSSLADITLQELIAHVECRREAALSYE